MKTKYSEENLPTVEKQNNVEKRVGSLLIVNNKTMEIFNSNEAGGKAYANVISDFSSKLDSDVKIYSMLVPTQIEFIGCEKYKDLSSSQKMQYSLFRCCYL